MSDDIISVIITLERIKREGERDELRVSTTSPDTLKMLNITNQRNLNQNHNDTSIHT